MMADPIETGLGCGLGGAVFVGGGAIATFFFPALLPGYSSQLPTIATSGCAVGAVVVNTLLDVNRLIANSYERALQQPEPSAPGQLTPPRTPPAPSKGPEVASR